MYRYYQRHEKDAWFAVSVKQGDDPLALAVSNGAKKLTILTVNELIADGDDPENPRNRDRLTHRGPLYFDIDCKGDLALAIESGNELVERLLKLGVPEAGLQIFLSGSKGIHVLVDENLFSSGRFFKRLPETYKEMARDLYVPGIDFSVYAGGRGNSFRIPNVERYDGRYRVPVTVTELKALDEDKYRLLVSAPRSVPFAGPLPTVKVPELMAMFEAARKRLGAKQTVVIIATSAELEKIRYEPPACIQALCDAKSLKNETNFNQVATQLATYIVRAGVEPMVADALAARCAEANSSSQYGSVRARREHIEAQIRYVEHTPTFSFGCNAIRALLAKRLCEGCPIETGTNADGEGDDFDISAEARTEGYFVRFGENWKRVTNFVLQPQDVFIEIPQDGTSPRRMGTRMGVIKGGVEIGKILFKESSFGSRSGFLKEIEGVSDLTFQGSDLDVQRIKIAIYREDQDVGEVYQVYTSGIHLDWVGGEPVFTYVEPDLSINNLKVKGTHQYLGMLQARPYFGRATVIEAGDKDADRALTAMMQMSKPLEMALIIGWISACHFKTHLMHLHSQFPILSLWGSAGSGKSVTAGLVTWLNGTDYMSQDSGINAPSASPYGMLDYLSGTTTIPRIIEEYNKSKMDLKAFKDTGERIKQAWGGESAIKGKLGGKGMGRVNAETVVIPMSSPIIVISEQAIEMPAIQERSLRVQLTKAKREGRRNHFEYARRNRDKLRAFGKALMIQALNTSLDEVDDLMSWASDMLPDSMDDRPRYTMQCVLLGLRKLKEAAEALNLPYATSQAEDFLAKVLERYGRRIGQTEEEYTAQAEEVGAIVKSETDLVVEKLCLIIALSRGSEEAGLGANNIYMREGMHYGVPKGNKYLVIDQVFCHAAYTRFMNQEERQTPVIASASQFVKLIQEEPYYAGLKPFEGMGGGRPMMFFDLKMMRKKGIDTSLILGGADSDIWSDAV